MNIWCGLGRITKDVEVKYTQGAEPMAIARFTLAVDRTKKGEADFISCVAFQKTAENIGKFFSKGSQIAVTGHIQTGSFQKQDGSKVYTTDVIVDRFDFCGSAEQPKTEAQNDGFMQASMLDLNDGSLPFC